jgi:hypothetical protein
MRLVEAGFDQYPVQDFQFNVEGSWGRNNKKNGRKAFGLSFFFEKVNSKTFAGSRNRRFGTINALVLDRERCSNRIGCWGAKIRGGNRS